VLATGCGTQYLNDIPEYAQLSVGVSSFGNPLLEGTLSVFVLDAAGNKAPECKFLRNDLDADGSGATDYYDCLPGSYFVSAAVRDPRGAVWASDEVRVALVSGTSQRVDLTIIIGTQKDIDPADLDIPIMMALSYKSLVEAGEKVDVAMRVTSVREEFILADCHRQIAVGAITDATACARAVAGSFTANWRGADAVTTPPSMLRGIWGRLGWTAPAPSSQISVSLELILSAFRNSSATAVGQSLHPVTIDVLPVRAPLTISVETPTRPRLTLARSAAATSTNVAVTVLIEDADLKAGTETLYLGVKFTCERDNNILEQEVTRTYRTKELSGTIKEEIYFAQAGVDSCIVTGSVSDSTKPTPLSSSDSIKIVF
jgi:hypothetical protein